MASMRGPRLQVGTAAWVSEERASATQIVDSEVEEFSYSARNEMDWLNEHMAGIFDENETNFADTFKTPGKLRGKTPRTARKPIAAEGRVPLSDVFGATPNVPSSHFSPRGNLMKSPKVLRDTVITSPEALRSPSPRKQIAPPKAKEPLPDTQDSGYYGSQDMAQASQSFRGLPGSQDLFALHTATHVPVKMSSARALPGESPEKTFQTAREEQTTRTWVERPVSMNEIGVVDEDPFVLEDPASSPLQSKDSQDSEAGDVNAVEQSHDDAHTDAEHSPSETSSPVRRVDRTSGINFAPFPARDPLPIVKAKGARGSRVSYLDSRSSYYGQAVGKSLGNVTIHASDDDNHDEEMTMGDAQFGTAQTKYEDLAADHSKRQTQRLQDQISLLGKPQAHSERPTKSISDGMAAQKPVGQPIQATPTLKSPSPFPMATLKSTPGAFPEDEDDWIQPPPVSRDSVLSPRPFLPKSHTADIMEGIHDAAASRELMDTITSPQRQLSHEAQRPATSSEHFSSTRPGPASSPLLVKQTPALHKAATVADMRLASTATLPAPDASPKSPTRSYRDSPFKHIKHVKNQLSSIFKSSRVLMASGAALSAEGKSSILSPSVPRLAQLPGLSMESLAEKPLRDQQLEPYVPEASPTRYTGKRTRASIEKEKEDKKRDKETRCREEQAEKLDKVRAQEREKARDFSKDKETFAKQIPAAWKDAAQAQKTPKTTRTSPRKLKHTEEGAVHPAECDVDMFDAPSTIPPPAPRSVGPASALRARELKRPIKPVKETLSKPKLAPTVIKVKPGSQHSQHLTSNSAAPASSNEIDATPQPPAKHPQLNSKASQASLKNKPSTQTLRAAAPTGRVKPVDAAAKKKEQDEREALRRREAKADSDRKRAAAQEEQRKAEHLRRQEAERQKQQEREQLTQAEAKKNAQRQAAIERAKQTRAPPPAARNQIQAPLEYPQHQEKRISTLSHAKTDSSRPPSRMTSGLPRSQDETGRPTGSHHMKLGAKRTLPAESGPSQQAKDSKRPRTSNEFDDEHDGENHPNIKGPPVRPSNGFKKDIPAKAAFPSNYSNVPQSATRDLFKATVTAQQAKSAHLMDMAQITSGAIPFAPHGKSAAGHPTKTPVRTTALNGMKASAAKSAAKSSPKFQNGEEIELAEIQTDDEDDEDDEHRGNLGIADWANSPILRRILIEQEPVDPAQIFGIAQPLDMEKVFNKSKEKFSKFRARTSSANWAGADRLTEEDIRKDMAAREELRRKGTWTYEMSKNLL